MTIRTYCKIFNYKEFNDYYKFTFVRDPWDRLASAYYFLKDGGFHENDKKWYKENLKEYNNFDDFVNNWVNKKNIYK